MNLFKEIYNYRQMIIGLVRKDLRGRYKGSVLGFLWTFVNPLLQMAVYSIVFSSILRVVDVEKYYIFLFVALIPWIFFSSSIAGGSSSIIASKDLVTKIYFPREVIPIAYVTSCFVNMLLCFIVVFAVLIISGLGINFIALLYLPVVLVVEYMLALGFALISSAVTVFFRDLEHILGILMMAWMYFTPIMYNTDTIPEAYRAFFNLNPMFYIITAYRSILYYKAPPDVSTLVPSFVLSLGALAVGFGLFSVLKKRFAEEL